MQIDMQNPLKAYIFNNGQPFLSSHFKNKEFLARNINFGSSESKRSKFKYFYNPVICDFTTFEYFSAV